VCFKKLLNEVRGKDEEGVINEVAIRSMAKAVILGGEHRPFWPGFQYYTHFTSPIRRYPDFDGFTGSSVNIPRKMPLKAAAALCENPSRRLHLVLRAGSVWAMEAERGVGKSDAGRVYESAISGEQFNAIISGVTNFGLFVEIARPAPSRASSGCGTWKTTSTYSTKRSTR